MPHQGRQLHQILGPKLVQRRLERTLAHLMASEILLGRQRTAIPIYAAASSGQWVDHIQDTDPPAPNPAGCSRISSKDGHSSSSLRLVRWCFPSGGSWISILNEASSWTRLRTRIRLRLVPFFLAAPRESAATSHSQRSPRATRSPSPRRTQQRLKTSSPNIPSRAWRC